MDNQIELIFILTSLQFYQQGYTLTTNNSKIFDFKHFSRNCKIFVHIDLPFCVRLLAHLHNSTIAMITTIVPATTEPAITPVFREEDASSIIKIKEL